MSFVSWLSKISFFQTFPLLIFYYDYFAADDGGALPIFIASFLAKEKSPLVFTKRLFSKNIYLYRFIPNSKE